MLSHNLVIESEVKLADSYLKNLDKKDVLSPKDQKNVEKRQKYSNFAPPITEMSNKNSLNSKASNLRIKNSNLDFRSLILNGYKIPTQKYRGE